MRATERKAEAGVSHLQYSRSLPVPMSLTRLFLSLPLLIATPALAQSEDAPDTSGDSAIVGAAAVYVPDYEGSDDYSVSGVPAITGRLAGFNFQFVANRGTIDLIPDSNGPGWDFQAGPMGAVNFNRTSTKRISDARIKALGDVGTAIELGGFVGIARNGVVTSDYDRLSVTLSYRHDVNGVHDSGVWTASVTYMTPLSRKAMVTVFASADHVADSYARTYFGVTPAGAVASGLPAYTPEGGWKNWTVGMGGATSLTGDLTGGLQLVGGVTYRRLLGDMAASPVVSIAGSRDQWMGALGLAYSF